MRQAGFVGVEAMRGSTQRARRLTCPHFFMVSLLTQRAEGLYRRSLPEITHTIRPAIVQSRQNDIISLPERRQRYPSTHPAGFSSPSLNAATREPMPYR